MVVICDSRDCRIAIARNNNKKDISFEQQSDIIRMAMGTRRGGHIKGSAKREFN